MKPRRGGGSLPGERQRLLLRACLLPGPEGREAWVEWRCGLDLDAVDEGSYRLLPLLSHALASRGEQDPLAGTFRGVYRRTWYQNQVMLHRLAPLLDLLHRRGMPVMLLKGAALALRHYRDPGLRPMADADLLVPRGRALEAVALLFDAGWIAEVTPQKGFSAAKLLARAGWAPRPRARGDFTETYCSVRHAHAFRGPDNQSIDLHWHMYQDNCCDRADDPVWERGVPVEVHGAPALVPSPSDLFLHICVHGARWNPVPPVRWAADALAVAGSGVDWDLLAGEAVRRHLTLPLFDTLGWLEENLSLPVPFRTLEALRSAPVTAGERRRYIAETSPPGLMAGLLELWLLRHRWWELKGVYPEWPEMTGFPAFLRHILGMNSCWQIPLYAAFEAIRRLRRSVIGWGIGK